MKTLNEIVEKYFLKECKKNYDIGGGLDGSKFASNRHEDAKHDDGKLTLGKATRMFAKATGLTIEEVKEVLNYAVPNMEYHHAGLLPKACGGGMKKTYFLNSRRFGLFFWVSLAFKCAKTAIAKGFRLSSRSSA